jgi:hypothetical protein
MSHLLLGILLALAPSDAPETDRHAQHDHHQSDSHAPPAPGDANLIVTINPEARVSVAKAMPLPLAECGRPVPLKIRVVNQGFVTAPLKASLADDGDRHVRLESAGPRLTGNPNETREMRLTQLGSNPADITLVFSISEEIGDLNGRDRTHLLIACR